MAYPSVVKIYATTQEPDYDSPWQASSPSRGTGSGVVIASGLILTGAHIVANSTFLQVQKVADPNKAIATIKSICHDCDLALLSIEDEDFMNGIEPAMLGELPDLRDRVSVVGYPVGGEEISITEGVVSRIEVQRYSHSQRHFLAVTVDAAINSGNSGGPVFKDGKVVGIAFQKLNNAENIGEMVPVPLVQHFLDIAKKTFSVSLPGFGFSTQKLENALLRQYLGMKTSESGVLISNVIYDSSSDNLLFQGDVLLKINGLSIANNGTISLYDRYRTRYDAILGECSFGDKVTFDILRKKQYLTVDIYLNSLKFLIPRSQYDIKPTYLIYGGIVFQTLTRDFLETWKNWWDEAPKEFLHLYFSGIPTKERQEIVIISQILADEVNVGYEGFFNEFVIAVNDIKIRNMQHLLEIIRSSQDVVKFETSNKGVIILNKKEMDEATKRICQRYHIAKPHSIELAKYY